MLTRKLVYKKKKGGKKGEEKLPFYFSYRVYKLEAKGTTVSINLYD